MTSIYYTPRRLIAELLGTASPAPPRPVIDPCVGPALPIDATWIEPGDRPEPLERTCAGCQHWCGSTKRSIGGGPWQQMCMRSGSVLSAEFTSADDGCEGWEAST